jgi:hypothetical protein
MSPKKTFCVYATTAREKIEWMTHISNCIDKLSSKIECSSIKISNIFCNIHQFNLRW